MGSEANVESTDVSVPACSVVIPAYNSEDTVGETLDSVLAQTMSDFELIVVDDGSSDGTPGRIAIAAESDPRVRLITQENGGTAAARNAGIAAARAPFVSFLDDDDLWLPGYLERSCSALLRFPDAGFAFSNAWLYDQDRSEIRRRTSFEHYPDIPDHLDPEELLRRLIEINFVLSSTTCRATVLAETGGFATEVSGTDDWDLWMRIAAAGHGAAAVMTPGIVQRDRSDSQSKDLAMMFERSAVTLRRLLSAAPLSEANQAAARAHIEALERKITDIRRNSLKQRARRVRQGAIAVRERINPTSTWLAEPPAEVAAAFPGIAASYARAASNGS